MDYKLSSELKAHERLTFRERLWVYDLLVYMLVFFFIIGCAIWLIAANVYGIGIPLLILSMSVFGGCVTGCYWRDEDAEGFPHRRRLVLRRRRRDARSHRQNLPKGISYSKFWVDIQYTGAKITLQILQEDSQKALKVADHLPHALDDVNLFTGGAARIILPSPKEAELFDKLHKYEAVAAKLEALGYQEALEIFETKKLALMAHSSSLSQKECSECGKMKPIPEDDFLCSSCRKK